MTRIVVVCEGQTEETFVRDVLRPHFDNLGLFLSARLIETSPGYRGGGLNYDRVRPYLRNTLLEDRALVVTTLFDLYALDRGFPGFAEAGQQGELGQKIPILTAALHRAVVAEAQCRPERFIPHIQPHEFEALLFSDVEALCAVEAGWAGKREALIGIRSAAPTPEHINDRPETTPAAHLDRILTPKYRKVRHGSLAARRIGLARIEQECPIFADWIACLRAIPA